MRPRIRTIKPEAHTDERLWDLEQDTGLPIFRAFVGLWNYADREGRFEWRARPLKAGILPYWEGDFESCLAALALAGMVIKYEVDRREYGLIPSFSRHQAINQREARSELPGPSEEATTGDPEPVPQGHTSDSDPAHDADNAGESPDTCTHVHAHGEGKGREGKGRERDAPVRGLDEKIRRNVRAVLDHLGVVTKHSREHRDLDALTAPMWGELARWCQAKAEADGESPTNVAALVIEGWATAERVAQKGHPLTWLVRSPGEWYLAGLEAERVAS